MSRRVEKSGEKEYRVEKYCKKVYKFNVQYVYGENNYK